MGGSEFRLAPHREYGQLHGTRHSCTCQVAFTWTKTHVTWGPRGLTWGPKRHRGTFRRRTGRTSSPSSAFLGCMLPHRTYRWFTLDRATEAWNGCSGGCSSGVFARPIGSEIRTVLHNVRFRPKIVEYGKYAHFIRYGQNGTVRYGSAQASPSPRPRIWVSACGAKGTSGPNSTAIAPRTVRARHLPVMMDGSLRSSPVASTDGSVAVPHLCGPERTR
jgi:hypothetical protein